MSLKERRIDVTMTIGGGPNGDEVVDTMTLTNHRVHAIVENVVDSGMGGQGQLSLRIYGLPLEMMNRMTTIGPINTEIRGKNGILVAAGDDGDALTTIFDGTIDTAFADFQGMPDVALVVYALAAGVAAVKPVEPSSYKGPVDVSVILADLAGKMGFSFESNGVSVILNSPYLPGTPLQQAQSVVRAAGICMVIDGKKMAIFSKGGARDGDVPEISPATGLVGYPTFCSNGISLTSIFLPQAHPGGQINVASSIEAASGLWNTCRVGHDLESRRPGGSWFTHIIAARPIE